MFFRQVGRNTKELHLLGKWRRGTFVQPCFTDGDNARLSGLTAQFCQLFFYIIYIARMNTDGAEKRQWLGNRIRHRVNPNERIDNRDNIRRSRHMVRMYIVVNHRLKEPDHNHSRPTDGNGEAGGW